MGSSFSTDRQGNDEPSGGAVSKSPQSEGDRSSSVKYLLETCFLLRMKFQDVPEPVLQQIIDFSGLCGITSRTSEVYSNGCDNENRLHMSHSVRADIDRRVFRPVSIVVTVESCDQGWTSYPEIVGRRESHTFGELCVKGARFPCYRNIAASKSCERQTIEFSSESLIMRNILSTWNDELNRPFIIELWTLSRYPGWRNRIRFANISVVWGVNICILFEKHSFNTMS